MPTLERIEAVGMLLVCFFKFLHICVHELPPNPKFLQKFIQISPLVDLGCQYAGNEVDGMAVALVGHAETVQEDVFSVPESSE
jgi:hypothetical protein